MSLRSKKVCFWSVFSSRRKNRGHDGGDWAHCVNGNSRSYFLATRWSASSHHRLLWTLTGVWRSLLQGAEKYHVFLITYFPFLLSLNIWPTCPSPRSVLSGPKRWVPNRSRMDWLLARLHRPADGGGRGQLPCSLHLTFYPGDLCLPHLPHLHLWDFL